MIWLEIVHYVLNNNHQLVERKYLRNMKTGCLFFTSLENIQKIDLLCTFLITFPLFTNCLYLTISFPVCISSCLMATIATKAPRPQSRKRTIRNWKQKYWRNSRDSGRTIMTIWSLYPMCIFLSFCVSTQKSVFGFTQCVQNDLLHIKDFWFFKFNIKYFESH